MATFKVAAVQASPIFFDKAATLDKTIALISEAASSGAKLVVFPELFIPGYPFNLWTSSYGDIASRVRPYYANACAATGPESFRLQEVVMRLQINAVIGFAEVDGGSLYMSQWILTTDGKVVVRRKLKPTSMERIMFGEGDGSDIKVHDTPIGRLGALQCWEHSQPLLKHIMGTQHEQIHCASWPYFPPKLPHYSLSADANRSLSQTYAIETGAFVIASSAPLSQQNQDVVVLDQDELRALIPVGGGMTAIFDPEGRPLAEAPSSSEECIVYADVDLGKCYEARAILDPSGHYGRGDVFQVQFDNTPRQHVVTRGLEVGQMRKGRAEVFGDAAPVAVVTPVAIKTAGELHAKAVAEPKVNGIAE